MAKRIRRSSSDPVVKGERIEREKSISRREKRLAARARDGQKPRDQFSIEQVGDALESSMGHYSVAAKKLRCSYDCVRNYVERYPILGELKDAIEEGHLDLAEGKLLKKIKAGNLDATKFFLKTKGKKRGYSERTEISTADGRNFGITIMPAPGVKMIEPEYTEYTEIEE